MNRTIFFNHLRKSKDIFGSTLSQATVTGIESILDAGSSLPIHHLANVLAQVYRETGGYMAPIKETVMPSHKDKNPSDAEVIRRLDNAYAKGQLTWVKTPYWGKGAFGRGQIQLTHEDNYRKFGITSYADALKPEVSARVAVEGMSKGMFTGKKLSDYNFPAALDAPPKLNPRRIVNGPDGSDAEVARNHRAFYSALLAAGYAPVHEGYYHDLSSEDALAIVRAPAVPAPDRTKDELITQDEVKGLFAPIVALLKAIFGGRK